MVDTNGMEFGSRCLDAREAFPLSTRFGLARLFEENTSMNRYSKTHTRTYCKHYKALHCLPCSLQENWHVEALFWSRRDTKIASTKL
jgi:hypothetical protein